MGDAGGVLVNAMNAKLYLVPPGGEPIPMGELTEFRAVSHFAVETAADFMCELYRHGVVARADRHGTVEVFGDFIHSKGFADRLRRHRAAIFSFLWACPPTFEIQ